MNIESAQKFVYQNARPLDWVRWQYLLEQGSQENVLKALAAYQNADGGFGHALEADSWNPESAPMQTWAATAILREIHMEEKNHPLVQGILRYLENTQYFNGHIWYQTIPSNNQHPHAPWWNDTPTKENEYNPTASLIGFVFRYADSDSQLYRTAQRLLQEAYAYFKQNCPLESMHTAACFVELYEDLSAGDINAIDMNEFKNLLKAQIKHLLTNDISAWRTEYVCKPSLFIHSKQSCFYEDHQELCDAECRFIAETQNSDGTWNVTWDWGCYPEQWHISKNWWKTDIILKNIQFYQAMHR